MFARSVTAFALVAALSAPAFAQDNKLQIFRDVQRQVLRYAHFTVFDSVGAEIHDNGVLTLTGKVTMPYKRDDIEQRVSRVAGVQRIENKIEVLPVSQFDDDLRWGIARAIYSNPAFSNYAGTVNPPVHVIVERGRVTLEGVVNSEVERAVARSIAGSSGAFEVKNELKLDKEVQQALEKL
jgi:hyperosmotically inducible periplasmic protein